MHNLVRNLSAGLMVLMLLQFSMGLAQAPLTPLVPGGNAGNPAGSKTSEQSPFAPSFTTPTVTPGMTPSPLTPAVPNAAESQIEQQILTPPDIPPLGPQIAVPGALPSNLPEPASLPPDLEKRPLPAAELPEGTLAPVTLKATLEKTQTLPLSLEQALQLAQGQNISIQIADETAYQAHLTYLLRLSDLLPDLTMQYVQSRFVGAIQIFGGSVMDIFRTTYQPQITANYIIYTGGSNIFAIKASKQREEAQKNVAAGTLQTTLGQVAQGYYDLQQAYLQRAIALQGIQEATEQLHLNQARETGGVGIRLDVLQAQTALSAQQDLLIAAENQIGQASENLAQLLNLDFKVDLVPSSLEAYIIHLLPDDLTGACMMDVARVNNPNLQALLAEYNATRTDVKTVITSYFPQIAVSAYYNGTGPDLNSLQPARFAGIQASTNVLSNMGFQPVLTVKQARTQSNIALLNYNNAERVLERDLSNAVINLHALERQVQVARQTLQFAKATYDNAFGRMQAGVGTNLDLQTALTNLTRARSLLAAAFINYNKAQVALITLMGVASTETLTVGYQTTPSATKTP